MEGNAGRGIPLRGPELAPSLSPLWRSTKVCTGGHYWQSGQQSFIYSLPLLTVTGSPCHCESSWRCFSLFTRLDVKRRWCSSFSCLVYLTYGRLPESGLNQGATMSAISGRQGARKSYAVPPIMTSECPQDDGAAPLLCSFNFCNTSKCPVEIIQFLEFRMGVTHSWVLKWQALESSVVSCRSQKAESLCMYMLFSVVGICLLIYEGIY